MQRAGVMVPRALVGLVVAFMVLAVHAASAQQAPGWPKSLKGQLLVAEPSMPDPNFDHTVIFMVEHDDEGAFGVVINRSYGDVPLDDLLASFGKGDGRSGDRVEVLYGGPVSPELGMVLHSNDYTIDGTRSVGEGLSFTTSAKVLEDMAAGRGPRRSLLMMGYSGWGPGQLEREIKRGDWFWIPADSELVLSSKHHLKWEEAMATRGTAL